MSTFTRSLLAAAAAFASSQVLAVDVASDVQYANIHGTMDITNAKITSVSDGTFAGNVAVVRPGATLTLNFDAAIDFVNADYCRTCIIQGYLAWDSAAQAAGATPRQINLYSGIILSDRAIGNRTWTVAAPTVAGEYFIGGATSLQYGYVPVAGGLGNQNLASFKVTVTPVPEPESIALMLAGLGVVGFAAARSQRRS